MSRVMEARFRFAQCYLERLFNLGAMYGSGTYVSKEATNLFRLDWGQLDHAWRWITTEMHEDLGLAEWYLFHYRQGVPALFVLVGPRQVVRWSEKAVDASKLLKDVQEEIQALSILGDAYGHLGEKKRCLQICKRALSRARQVRDVDLIMLTLSNAASAYLDADDVGKSLDAHKELLNLSIANQNLAGVGEALLGLGQTYFDMQNYEKALENYKPAVGAFKKVGDKIGLSHALTGLGACFTKQGRLDEADAILRYALQLSKSFDDSHSLAEIHRHIGWLEVERGEWADAAAHLGEVVDIVQEREQPHREAIAKDEMERLPYLQLQADLATRLEAAKSSGSREAENSIKLELDIFSRCFADSKIMSHLEGEAVHLHEFMATMALHLAQARLYERAIYYAENAIAESRRQGKTETGLVKLLTGQLSEWKQLQ